MNKKGQKASKNSVKKKAKLMAAIGNPILGSNKNKPMKIKSHQPDSNYA
jgi:hypothetical protein